MNTESLAFVGVKSVHRKTIAIGCESPLARGKSRNTARYAAFSILATNFGGSNGRAQVLPVTLRVPRSLTLIRAAAPCESGSAVVHQAQLGSSMSTNLHKTCKKCGGAEFYSTGDCKPCAQKRAKAYRAKNPEKAKQAVENWKTKNPEKLKAGKLAYYAANRDVLLADFADRYKKNPEPAKARTIAWSKINQEHVKEYNRAWHKANPNAAKVISENRRARKLNNGGRLSRGLSAKLFVLQKGKCACCGLPLGASYHMDHVIPLALGGSNTDDNIQLLRQRCNSQKGKKHPIDFMQSRGFLL